MTIYDVSKYQKLYEKSLQKKVPVGGMSIFWE